MTTVSTTVNISIPEEGMTLEALEEMISSHVQQAASKLLLHACKAQETRILDNQEPGVHRNKQRPLDLLTRFGWIRLTRWQVKDKDGHYDCPLDDVLDLKPRQHASPWIKAQAVSLSTRLPYRQAAYLLSSFVEEPIDHRTLYRWVQQAGAHIVAQEDELQEAVFVHGEIPPRDSLQREIVVAEVDGTFLRAQREETRDFEVRMGVLASGKALESVTAKHRRYRLLERVCYAGVERAQDFGERLFLTAEAHLGLSHARHLLLVGDGADWIEALAGHNRWRAIYQLDWWHLTHAFHRTFPEHPRLVQALKQALYEEHGDKIVNMIRMAKINHVGDPERVDKLLTYVKSNRNGFFGARRLREKLSDQAKLVCVEGSGAVEKHIDIGICRRFKGQGMRWTRAGANRLLKLRLLELERAA